MQTKKIPLLAFAMLAVFVVSSPSCHAREVQAQGAPSGVGAGTLLPNVTTLPPTNPVKLCLDQGDCHLNQLPYFILYISNYLIGLAGTVALLMVMYGGYLYILGGVNEANKGKGMKTISTALMGLAITLLAYLLVKALEGLLLS